MALSEAKIWLRQHSWQRPHWRNGREGRWQGNVADYEATDAASSRGASFVAGQSCFEVAQRREGHRGRRTRVGPEGERAGGEAASRVLGSGA